jgi:ActR/RegA family two-component response regulator
VFDVQQALEVVRHDTQRWEFAVLDVEGMGDRAQQVCAQLLTTFADMSIIAIVGSSREPGDVLSVDPRIEIVEKPINVWSVETALQRLRASHAEMAKSQQAGDPT